MVHVTGGSNTDADTPFNYLPEDYANVLGQLLNAVPEAKELFNDGFVSAAIIVLNAAGRVKLNDSVGIPKHTFLAAVTLLMPNKYSV
jgi:hypothetical protein